MGLIFSYFWCINVVLVLRENGLRKNETFSSHSFPLLPFFYFRLFHSVLVSNQKRIPLQDEDETIIG